MSMLEIIVQSTHDALTAEKNGADQLDLKANYAQGGVTPSAGQIEMICNLVKIPVLIMIHPHSLIFSYSKTDLQIMCTDIRQARNLGARNFLIGCISPKMEIDQSALSILLDAAEDAHLHFNLVWQLTTSPLAALDILMQYGIKTIRSSGKGFIGDHAMKHLVELKLIQEHVKNSIQVFAAGGVNADNIPILAAKTCIPNFHTGSGARKSTQPFGPIDSDCVSQLKNAMALV